jgi:uncharacterized RDD family membrane protein YckC
VTGLHPSHGSRAGFVSRFAAFFVDAVILSVMVRSLDWLLGASARVLGRFAPPIDLQMLLLALVPLLVVVYHLAFWTVAGRTPGKWLMGLQIVPSGGGQLTLKRAALRQLGYLLSALPCYLGFLWILGPQRRAWHDRLARTEVTYARRKAPETTRATALRQRLEQLGGDAAGGPPLPDSHAPA